MNYFYDILPDEIRKYILKVKQQEEYQEKCKKYIINELNYIIKRNLWFKMELVPSMLLKYNYLDIILQFEQKVNIAIMQNKIRILSNFAKQNKVSILEGRRLIKHRVLDKTYIKKKHTQLFL